MLEIRFFPQRLVGVAMISFFNFRFSMDFFRTFSTPVCWTCQYAFCPLVPVWNSLIFQALYCTARLYSFISFLHCAHFQALYFCTCGAFGINGRFKYLYYSEMISSKWNWASHKQNICKDSICDKAAAGAAGPSIFYFSERMTIHQSCSLAHISTSPRCKCVCVCVFVYEWDRRLFAAGSANFPTCTLSRPYQDD